MRIGSELQAEKKDNLIKGKRQGQKEIKRNKEKVDERDSQAMTETEMVMMKASGTQCSQSAPTGSINPDLISGGNNSVAAQQRFAPLRDPHLQRAMVITKGHFTDLLCSNCERE